MWSISTLNTTGATQVYACDGQPITATPRDVGGGVCRLIIAPFGYIDLVDQVHVSDGLPYWTLDANGQVYPYSGDAVVSITVTSATGFTLTGAEGTISGDLKPLPVLAGETIDAFRQMIEMKIVPYQNPPSGTEKSAVELQALADAYFPGNPYGFDLAMALYDWTSSDFIRQDIFSQLQYTGVAGCPLDLVTMANVIWGCNYPGYSAQDANFMNQFTMQPAYSLQNVYDQLQQVAATVKPLAMAELDVFKDAILRLSPLSVAECPYLYRGAMPMSGGYDTGDFAPSLSEFSGNEGPTFAPLYQAFSEALDGVLKPGSIITTKGPWSFSNDLAGAKVWQNGILITLRPPQGAKYWPGCADITPFSLNPETFEVNMPPPTRYRIESYEWTTIEDKPVCHFTMTILGYCVAAM